MFKKTILFVFILLVGCVGASSLKGRQYSTAKSPLSIGKKSAAYILQHPADASYWKACANYGVLIFADETNNAKLRDKVIKLYNDFFKQKKMPHPSGFDGHTFGIVHFELFRQTGDSDYLNVAKYLAYSEWKDPRPDVLSKFTRFMSDDMYMAGSLQIQAYKNLQDIVYADRAALHLETYINKLQTGNGLFYHTDKARCLWGRGNGWAAAAMTEALLALPDNHPKKAIIMSAYKKMMEGLVEYQDKSGLWHQLLDENESFLETSCTGMFIFALSNGVAQGWLPEKPYKEVALKAWLGLTEYVNDEGEIREVCIGTGVADNKEYYMTRPKAVGDFHGQAPLMWAATGMLRME